MKLKKEYLPHQAMGEYMLIPTGEAEFKGLVKGNETFGLILDCLQKDVTEATITERLTEVYDGVTPEKAESDVHKVIERLRGIGALEE